MPPREVLVTYTAHPTGSADVHHAISAINSQLPLRNLHWKPSNRTSLRTIQELDVRLVELGEAAGGSQGMGGSVLERPLVNLCLVVCEDNDTYKNSTKSFIRDWLSLLAARRNEHALIILVNSPVVGAPKAAGVFGKTGGVLGKLKTDFNVGKKDRCVQVNLPAPGTNDPTAWPETINKLKESILGAFDAVLLEREDEVKRGEAQRMMVGWNFCSWFLLKESLAMSLEGMNLLEDTLIQYDELEASFFQVLKEQNLSWFGKLGALGPQDDSLPILDWTIKPYRSLIQNSQITIFDFRIYVFARQMELLGKLGRVTEAVTKAQWFIASLGRRLRENEADLAENFVESWTYHACLDVVGRCDQWAAAVYEKPGFDMGSALAGFDAAKSEVLDMARLQVERIGVDAGHLPKVFPFLPPTSLVPPADDVLFDGSDGGSETGDLHDKPPARAKISSRELLEAMSDKELFDELYSALTERVLEAYEACGRRRQAARLRGSLAALETYNCNYAKAYEIYHQLSALTSLAPRWDEARAYAMNESIKSHRLAKLPIDSRWTALALAYLHIESSRPSGFSLGKDATDTKDRLLEVITTLREHAQSLDEDVLVEDHAAFSVRILDSQARRGGDHDGSSIEVEVTNHLPVAIEAGNVRVCFWNNDVDQMWYTTGIQALVTGTNRMTAYCPVVAEGTFHQDVAQINVGRFNFDYVTPLKTSDVPPNSLKIAQDQDALDVQIEMPMDIALDEPPRIVVMLKSGRSHIDSAIIRLSMRDDEVTFALSRAEMTSGDARLELASDTMTVGNLTPRSTTALAVPYGGQPRSDTISVMVRIDYVVNGQPKHHLTLRKVRSVTIALPLAVNVQDFFRPTCLLSKFTVSSDGRAALRVAGVLLDTEDDDSYIGITPCRQANAPPSIVTVRQPVSFVYKLEKKSGKELKPGPLRLAIRYRTITDEVGEAIRGLIDSISVPGSSKHGAFLHRALSSKLEDVRASNLWIERYLACGELDLGVFDRTSWVTEQVRTLSRSQLFEVDELKEAAQALKNIVEMLDAKKQLDTQNIPWRTLRIPVEIPQRSVLARSSLKLNPTRDLLYEGQAISATLHLATSFAWSAGQEPTQLQLSYDVVADSDTWLVTGQKRGVFPAGEIEMIPIDLLLVPMRHGSLSIPTVVIQPLLPQSRGSDRAQLPTCEAYQENAASIVEILPSRGRTAVLIPIARSEETWERDTTIGTKV